MQITLRVLIISFCLLTSFFAQDKRAEVDSVNMISYETIVSNIPNSIKIFSENLKKARAIKYPKGEGIALSNLALVYYLRGDYDKSTQYHFESFKIFSENNLYKELSDAYGEYGYQIKRRDLNKAVAYMQQAIKIAHDHQVSEYNMSKLYDNYGVLKEMESEGDSALHFYKKALDIKKKNNDFIGIPYSLNKIAVLKASQGKFDEAKRFLELSDEFREKEPGDFGRAENLSIHADLLKMQGKVEEAINAYEKCQKIADTLDYNYMVLYCYQNLTDLYKQKNDLSKALDTYQKYSAYKDSIINLETNEKVAQLEIAYETDQKNLQIKQNQLELKSRSQQLTFALVTVILLLLIAIGIYRYQRLKRKRVVKEIEFKNQLKNTELEKKLVEEKLNISRELHDNIGSQLTFIISSLDNLTYAPKQDEIFPKLNVLKSFSKDALHDLRNTIWALKQEDGDSEKLIIKLNEMVNKLNSSLATPEIILKNNFSKWVKLSSIQILNLFRVIQEALQNAIKYSSAEKVEICINDINGGVEIIIKDNGKGFNVDEMFDGNGLTNMRSRCEKAGAAFNIKSDKSGTTISCIINNIEEKNESITASALLK